MRSGFLAGPHRDCPTPTGSSPPKGEQLFAQHALLASRDGLISKLSSAVKKCAPDHAWTVPIKPPGSQGRPRRARDCPMPSACPETPPASGERPGPSEDYPGSSGNRQRLSGASLGTSQG
eukprot:3140007-Alexandrium_andersonii.AAC.1